MKRFRFEIRVEKNETEIVRIYMIDEFGWLNVLLDQGYHTKLIVSMQ